MNFYNQSTFGRVMDKSTVSCFFQLTGTTAMIIIIIIIIINRHFKTLN